LEPAIKKLKRC